MKQDICHFLEHKEIFPYKRYMPLDRWHKLLHSVEIKPFRWVVFICISVKCSLILHLCKWQWLCEWLLVSVLLSSLFLETCHPMYTVVKLQLTGLTYIGRQTHSHSHLWAILELEPACLWTVERKPEHPGETQTDKRTCKLHTERPVD